MTSDKERLDPAIEGFLETIGPLVPAYSHAVFSFVSVVHDGYETILRARLRLSMDPISASVGERSILSLRAAQLPLPGGGSGLRGLLRAVLLGDSIPVGSHLLKLLPESTRGYSTYHEKSEELRGRTKELGDCLAIRGTNPWPLLNTHQPALDYSLHAHAFDSLADLLKEYGLEPFGMSAECTLEISAGAVARIESASSVNGTSATVTVTVGAGLRPEGFVLVLRNAMRHGDPVRRRIDASQFKWKALFSHMVGESTFEVPLGMVMECRALYQGKIQDVRQLADPSATPNWRRLVVELNDPGLRKISDVLTGIRERDDALRNEFEASVAVLFYLLGFEAVRIGGNRRMTDGPDIYALIDNVEILVVEATSGAFSDEKCAKLIARVNDITALWSRNRADEDSAQVTGIVVTARRREELVSQLSALEKQGIIILCQADIVHAIDRTRWVAAPREILRYWKLRPLEQVLTHGIEMGGSFNH
jgi:hypothetical protein